MLDECAACGGQPDSLHHVVPKGGPHFGDDVAANLIALCGHGTAGCHGAFHGNPYIGLARLRPRVTERRDAEWVGRRCGEHFLTLRPDVIAYVLGKLGSGAGAAFLLRFYYIAPEDL